MTCKHCGICCSTVGAEIPTPKTIEDFEDIKWYTFHKGLTVYTDRDGSWNVQFKTKCKHLTKDNLCGIYKNRPPMCKDFQSETCDIDEDESCMEFSNPEQVDEYVKELIEKGKLKPKKKK